jgi:hypothetical protein
MLFGRSANACEPKNLEQGIAYSIHTDWKGGEYSTGGTHYASPRFDSRKTLRRSGRCRIFSTF